MNLTLTQILDLVGTLDDSVGENTPRERFRRWIKQNVTEAGQLRDYIEEALRNSGNQYNRALQDLVNYIGEFLGFEVTFGRYKGVRNDIGYDGIWKSPTGFYIVIEVKTTDAYSIRTSVLTGYIDELISDHKIPDWEHAMGLYVVGRPDSALIQLKNSIIAEKRTDQLRIISTDSLLSLAELKNEYDITHEDILSILKPSGPVIDDVVEIISKVVAENYNEKTEDIEETEDKTSIPPISIDVQYWMTPVKDDDVETSEEVINHLVVKEKIYAFSERTPGRKHIKPGDWICFYSTGKGIVAHAQIISKPEFIHHPEVRHPELYPWVFKLDNIKTYFDNPVIIDKELRSKLDAFKNKDPDKSWAWLVQSTRKVTEHDFNLLTR